MTLNLQPKRQQILLTIVGVLLVAVVLRFALSLDVGGEGGELAVKEQRVANLEQRLARKEVLQQQLFELSRQVAVAETGLLNGTTPALAAVDLQNRLTALITGTGATMTSQQVLPSPLPDSAKPSPYVEIPVQIVVSLTVRQLKDLLYGIRSSPVFLKMIEAEVRVAKPEEGVLLATLTVSGLLARSADGREVSK
jgi:hypothetical protein